MSPIHQSVARPRNAQGAGLILARLLAVAGCAAMLSGCYTDQLVYADDPQATLIASDYRLRHPISIQEGTRTAEIFVASKRGTLSASQRADILAFAHEWHREGTGGMLVDLPAGTANETPAANALPEIRSILIAGGVPAERIATRAYRPENPRALATIHISYSTMQATAGPCGLWPHDLGPTFDREYNENREYWNHGCADQRNLAAMIDNPADLVQPRGEAPTYTGHRTVMLDKYRRGEATATIDPNAAATKISDTGK